MFYSQFGEDRILAQYFHGRPAGHCVEVGANDGVADSNTFYFEQQGWECLLVEPNPALCLRIKTLRRCRLFECAASSAEGVATLNVAEGSPRAHGVSALGSETTTQARIAGYGFSSRAIQVLTFRLDTLLEQAALSGGLGFVSIDVEGHELAVLQGFSIDRWKPEILILEDNARFTDPSVRRHLAGFGYVPFRRTGVNDWYAHRSSPRLVNFMSRAGWFMAACAMRGRMLLKRIPGAVRVRDTLLRR